VEAGRESLSYLMPIFAQAGLDVGTSY
jgi:hypothetical protein